MERGRRGVAQQFQNHLQQYSRQQDSALMSMSSILVTTWGNGLFNVTGKIVRQELAGQSFRSLVADGRGGVLAIVGGHSLCRRSSDGAWTEIAKSEFDISRSEARRVGKESR